MVNRICVFMTKIKIIKIKWIRNETKHKYCQFFISNALLRFLFQQNYMRKVFVFFQFFYLFSVCISLLTFCFLFCFYFAFPFTWIQLLFFYFLTSNIYRCQQYLLLLLLLFLLKGLAIACLFTNHSIILWNRLLFFIIFLFLFSLGT